jgi:hypothetical protein
MEVKFVVTVKGSWIENDQPVTAAKVEKSLRRAVKEEFGDLADRMTVKRVPLSIKPFKS